MFLFLNITFPPKIQKIAEIRKKISSPLVSPMASPSRSSPSTKNIDHFDLDGKKDGFFFLPAS